MNKRFLSIFLSVILIVAFCVSNGKVFAYNEFYSSNDVLFYDENATDCGPGGSVISNLPNTVPEEYRTLFTRAAAQYAVNPSYLTSLYLSENYNTWKPFNTTWASSNAGASGPFQFMPLTWDAYKQDGDGDGVMDINNMHDAAFSAAYKIKRDGGTISTPLGNITNPFVSGTLLYMATLYNWGGGNMRDHGATEGASLSVAPRETQNYLNNIYSLITSNITKGGGGIPDPKSSTSNSQPTEPSTNQTVIALDPGHGGQNIDEIDPASGLITSESTDGASGEKSAMWDTAQIIKTKLEADGYKVILTKNSIDDPAGFVTKVSRVNQSGAAIAVSLHYTDGTFGTSNEHWGVTPQAVGLFRENKDNGKRKTFTDANIAAKSLSYSTIIAEARTAVGDTAKVSPLDQSFPENRAGLKSWGTISIVQLLGNVPWVYNETGINGFDKQKYATGIINGIERAVPPTGGGSTPCSNGGAVSGNLIQTAINYAWPDWHNALYITMKPTYETAITTAKSAGKYIGGIKYPGVDCGGFVTRVMQDSGVDPNYGGGGNTIYQQKYMDDHPELYEKLNITDTSGLKPGDIAINNGHTYLYVGEVANFNEKVASASLDQRAPMAGKESPYDPKFNYYRHK